MFKGTQVLTSTGRVPLTWTFTVFVSVVKNFVLHVKSHWIYYKWIKFWPYHRKQMHTKHAQIQTSLSSLKDLSRAYFRRGLNKQNVIDTCCYGNKMIEIILVHLALRCIFRFGLPREVDKLNSWVWRAEQSYRNENKSLLAQKKLSQERLWEEIWGKHSLYLVQHYTQSRVESRSDLHDLIKGYWKLIRAVRPTAEKDERALWVPAGHNDTAINHSTLNTPHNSRV